MTFGDWVQEYLETYQITKQDYSDYSGLHIRTLYRILGGQSRIKLDDWLWLIECLSDMTNINYDELVIDCLNKTVLKKDVKL